MKLIIYLASRDPSAWLNYNTLLDQRSYTVGSKNVDFQFIHGSDAGTVHLANATAPNVFNDIPLVNKNETHIELIAHGDDSPWIKSAPHGKWNYTPGAINTYKDISASNLRDFFLKYASVEGEYKFSELTLFCCNGYKFAKELALLMPEIKITCFKEFIQIRVADGMSYPYVVADKINKPIDKNGDIITKPDQVHYRAAQWVLKGNLEQTIYACADAIPNHISQEIKAEDSKPIAIRGNISKPPPHQEVRSSQEKSNDQTYSDNTLNMQEHSNSIETSKSENETLSTQPKMR